MTTASTTDTKDTASDVEMWRRAFHAEAMDCVYAMQAVVDRTKFSHFATRFDDWRKLDLKATAQVQMHVKELTRLNQSVEQFLHECGSLGNLAEFKDSFLALNQCVSELTVAKKEITASVDAIAERAAAKVASAWQAEAREAAEKQHMQWTEDSSRWGHLESRIGQLQDDMRELNDVVRKSTESSLEALKDHLTEMFRGSGGLNLSLESMERRMGEWEVATNTDLVHNREISEQLRQQVARLEDAAKGAKKRQVSAEEEWHDLQASLQSQVLSLQSELHHAQESVRDAHTSTWRSNLRKVNEIEGRGNVHLNRSNGHIRVVHGVDFTHSKPTQRPHPEFMHPANAERVALDLVELSGLFGGPVAVEVHVKPGKGGTPAYWDDVADAQATLLRTELERVGVPADRLSVQGLAGSKGQNLNVVIVKLDQELFPELLVAETPTKDPKRPAGSPRSRSPNGGRR